VGAGAVPLTDGAGMYRAEHRALRELHATGRQLASHWWRLGDRLGGAPAKTLQDGAAVGRGMVTELAKQTAERGLHGFPAAQGVGHRLAGLRNTAGDLVLERNQALRLAVLDAEHVTTLLAYLAALAEKRGDTGLVTFHRRWEGEIAAARNAVRDAAIALAADPDDAVQPAEASILGRAGHTAANALGTVGEALDGSPIGAAARKATGRQP
jgi:hypothetical protein